MAFWRGVLLLRRLRTQAPRGAAVVTLLSWLTLQGAPTAHAQDALPDSSGLAPGGLALVDSAGVGLGVDRTEIRPWRLALVGGGALGVGFAVMDVQRRRWWTERSPRFRIQNDWEYVLWSDKFGHVFSSSLYSRFYTTSLRWSGFSRDDAALYGAVAGWVQLLYYEALDGFGPIWGFSPGDLLFNTVGAGFTYAQHREPYLRAFDLKASYWPSGWEGKNLTDDYAGQTWWVTANLRGALPGRTGDAFPPWLNLAVGYAARDLDEREFLTTPYVYLGLDLELRGLPIDHPVWNAAVEWLRYIHLPAPAIRLTPRPALVLLAY